MASRPLTTHSTRNSFKILRTPLSCYSRMYPGILRNSGNCQNLPWSIGRGKKELFHTFQAERELPDSKR